jgi:hypothetical protein
MYIAHPKVQAKGDYYRNNKQEYVQTRRAEQKTRTTYIIPSLSFQTKVL